MLSDVMQSVVVPLGRPKMQTNRWTDGWIWAKVGKFRLQILEGWPQVTQTDIQTNGQTDIWMDRLMGRQTNRQRVGDAGIYT